MASVVRAGGVLSLMNERAMCSRQSRSRQSSSSVRAVSRPATRRVISCDTSLACDPNQAL